jgi:REP element-mobilizing transposase RayT
VGNKMEKPRNFEIDTYHHLYNRGAGKQKIFFDENDYKFFVKKLKEYKQKYSIEILSYCLMPNHFHIFIHQTTAELLGSKFIGNLTNSYTKSINKKYKRSGVLFQGRTKNKIFYNEDDFKRVVKYILLNPVKTGLVKKFDEWKYSSAKELIKSSTAIFEIKNSNFEGSVQTSKVALLLTRF